MNPQLNDGRSIYLQICDMIETDIVRGILEEEDRVPSTNELARRYTINPATAAKGVNILVDEGILYKKRGIGMFVSAGAVKQIVAQRKSNFYKQYVVGLAAEANVLNITKDELLKMVSSAMEGKSTL